jgi:TRAP-type transport system small permease protein
MAKGSRAMRTLEWCSVIVIVAMFGTVALQVFARYFLEVAPAWTEEVGRYLLVWLTALGVGIALRAADGYRGAVDFIVNAMPPRWGHALNLAFMAVTFAFLCMVAIKTFELVMKKMEVRTPALELPESYLYLGVFFMALLMVWGLSFHIGKEIRAFTNAGEDPIANGAEVAPTEDEDGGERRA